MIASLSCVLQLHWSQVMTYSVGIIGQGFVGGSLSTVLAERGVKPLVFDIAGKVAVGGVSTNSFNISEHVRLCDEFGVEIYFICLPTPMRANGDSDTSIVLSAIEEIANVPPPKYKERVVVIKSTVPPGTCQAWDARFSFAGTRVVFNPEFLTEARCLDDMREQDRIILGGHPAVTPRVAAIMEAAFPNIPVVQTRSSNAEMVKYVANCFLAVKVSFANEMRQICEAMTLKGVLCEYDDIIEMAVLDKRLGETHWQSPGPDGKMGFGGSCFPKDINAMICAAKNSNVQPDVLEAAWRKNLEVRPERDWEKLKGRAVV